MLEKWIRSDSGGSVTVVLFFGSSVSRGVSKVSAEQPFPYSWEGENHSFSCLFKVFSHKWQIEKNYLSQLIFQMRLLSLQLWMLSEQLSLLDLIADRTSLCLGCSHRVFWSWHKFCCCCVCVFYTQSHLFVLCLCSSWTHFFSAPQWWLRLQLSKQASDLMFYTQSTSLYHSSVTAFPDLLLLLVFLCFFFFFVVYMYFFIKLLLIHFLLSELEALWLLWLMSGKLVWFILEAGCIILYSSARDT